MMRDESWGEYNKSLLDKIIENLRTFRINKYISPKIKMLDLGCGYNASLLKSKSTIIDSGVGVDLSINNNELPKNIKLIKGSVENKMKLKSNQFDLITSLAIIEHLKKPDIMLAESYRLLKKKGTLILTTPSQISKPLLELLAYRLNVISKKEILDHKHYYKKTSLMHILKQSGFKKKNIEIKYFEFGLNIFAKATK